MPQSHLGSINLECIAMMIYVINWQLKRTENLGLNEQLYRNFAVSQLMKQPEALLSVNDTMDVVVSVFDRTGAWRLPVLDSERKYLGFISKSRLLMAYRAELKEIASED